MSERTFQRNLTRMVRSAESSHFLNDPAHAHNVVHQLARSFRSLDLSGQDDPLLYAYELMDVLPSLAALLIDLYKWADSCIESTPDQVFESGAQLERRGA